MARPAHPWVTAMGIALSMMSAPAAAETITFTPLTSDNNLFPFGEPKYVGEYQQVYSATRFASPVALQSVAFTPYTAFGPLAETVSSSFTLRLSTTSAGPSSITPEYRSNLGPDVSRVFAGTVIAHEATPFSFRVDFEHSFLYDPNRGDLLMDVVIDGNLTDRNKLFPFIFGSSVDMSRVYNINATGPAVTTSGSCHVTCAIRDSLRLPHLLLWRSAPRGEYDDFLPVLSALPKVQKRGARPGHAEERLRLVLPVRALRLPVA
jgi:hypothetical protein